MISVDSKFVLDVLKEKLFVSVDDFAALKIALKFKDPFQLLIMTILTQNTSDKNAIRAFNNLSKKFEINPKSLSFAPVGEIENAIKIAGMYKKRAIIIREVSRAILERFDGDLRKIFDYPLEKARELLISLPGVGRKTADVILLFAADAPTFPVDTHVNRVSKRLGIVAQNANYEQTRISLMKFFPPSSYLDAHLLLIALGRRYCKARNPLCASCPLKKVCRCASRTGKYLN
ncbi:MAG: endonuclease III [archaeon GB-1867-005]|nr:endonuclease III [Candidatus Culexmicrobium cathedralense]